MTKNLRFKEAREKLGLSQQEVADRMPLNKNGKPIKQPYIAQIENNKPYSLKQARKFAPILKTTAEWLCFGNEKDINTASNVEKSIQIVDNSTRVHNSSKGKDLLDYVINKKNELKGNSDTNTNEVPNPTVVTIQLTESRIAHLVYSGRLNQKDIQILKLQIDLLELTL